MASTAVKEVVCQSGPLEEMFKQTSILLRELLRDEGESQIEELEKGMAKVEDSLISRR